MGEMMDARFEVIDAFVDGERVDAAALKAALSEAEGREYLIDAWLLRESVQEDLALDASTPLPARRRLSGPRTWVLAASVAAACLLFFVFGYGAGGRSRSTTGKDAASTTAKATPASTSFPVPAPTRVIPVQFGAGADGGH